MAKILSMFVLVIALLAVGDLFQSCVAMTNHTVGDSTGWRIPPGGAATYSTWASKETFAIGDVLVFNFAPGSHDVTEVTKAAFDGCTTTKPISSTTTAPAIITLSSAGEHFFICSFPGHCGGGQNLSVNVSATPVATSPPPPHNSAVSFSAMALPAALLSAAVVAFFY